MADVSSKKIDHFLCPINLEYRYIPSIDISPFPGLVVVSQFREVELSLFVGKGKYLKGISTSENSRPLLLGNESYLLSPKNK